MIYISEQKFDQLKIEHVAEGNYTVISINRPDRLNALQTETLRQISEALQPLIVDEKTRCVVLRGTKDFTKKPAFSAGADLSAFGNEDLDPNLIRHHDEAMNRRHIYYDLIDRFPKPLIAAVDGFALGGGLELVLVCDIIIATKRSSFGFPEIQRGIFAANGGTQRMINSIGKFKVKEMMFFGEPITAQQMYDYGVVSFLTEADKFEDVIKEKATKLGKSATNSLYIIKKCVDYGSQVPLNVGLQFELFGYGINSKSEDVMEGVNAFLEKRKPEFKGR